MNVENLFGLHPVRTAIEYGKRQIKKLLVYDNYKNNTVKELIKLAESKDINICYTSKYELNGIINDGAHQNVILQCSPIELQMIKNLPQLPDRLILSLEGVKDPHNLGSIIRTCAFFNISVVLDRDCAALNAVTNKSSAGALEMYYCNNRMYKTGSFANLIHDRIAVASVCQPVALKGMGNLDKTEKYLLLMGSEGEGLKKTTLSKCMKSVLLKGNFDSLNVSVAAGILLHQFH